MKYHLVTLGCQMNKSDSERVATVLEGMGYIRTDNENEADLLGVLACSVRQKSIDKVYSKINKWNKRKEKENFITFISGCILPADKEKFLKLFDVFFLMSELLKLPEMLTQYGIVTPLQLNRPSLYEMSNEEISRPEEKIREFWKLTPACNSSFEAFIPIQNGCDKFCTFCAVPYTRGREISRSSAEILDELKMFVNKGYKSIILLGQNVNSYGFDKEGKEITFTELLGRIGEFGDSSGKRFLVYFTSPHPRDMKSDVIEVMSKFNCLANHIHIPLQSGDDKVLKRMNRKYTLDDFRKIIHDIREKLPSATIFTDIIVGFSGETGTQFENTRKAMEEFKFNMGYIARYSPRPGAVSARWEDDVPYPVKTERLHILTRELVKHTTGYHESLIGKDLCILVTGKDRKKDFYSGITEGRIITRFMSARKDLTGKFAVVKITSAAEYSVEGDLIEVTENELINA